MRSVGGGFQRFLRLGARLLLGAMFVYLGLAKAVDPVGFLKLIRQYDFVSAPLVLNFAAAVLPWLEIFCGLLLLTGLRRNAAALVILVLLVFFSVMIALRAWSLHRAGSLPFCAQRFDCGCGTGNVVACAKLLENFALIVLASFLTFARPQPQP